MSQRDAIRMTGDEISAFLAEWHTLQVATINPDGAPHIVPMWYVLLDGQIAFWTYTRSQKVLNLRRDPRLSCLVEEGTRYDELRGVQIRGRATLNDDPAVVLDLGYRLRARYNTSPDERDPATVARQAPKRVAIFVIPEEINSWDHRKLRAATPER